MVFKYFNVDKLKNLFVFSIVTGLFFNKDLLPSVVANNYSNFFYASEIYLLGRIVSYEKPSIGLALFSTSLGVASEIAQKYSFIGGVYDEKDIFAYIIGGVSMYVFDKTTKTLEEKLL